MFDRRNHYYEGYEQARMKGVPLTELYATAYNAWVSDSRGLHEIFSRYNHNSCNDG